MAKKTKKRKSAKKAGRKKTAKKKTAAPAAKPEAKPHPYDEPLDEALVGTWQDPEARRNLADRVEVVWQSIIDGDPKPGILDKLGRVKLALAAMVDPDMFPVAAPMPMPEPEKAEADPGGSYAI